MPTTRARHMITETQELERALDIAAGLWPEEAKNRADLLRHVLALGIQQIDDVANNRRLQREEAIRLGAGKLAGMWPRDEARQRVEEWPE